MRLFSFLLVALMLAVPASAKKNGKITKLEEPMTHYLAEATVNHLKRVETVGGFVVWAEQFMAPQRIVKLRQWLAKNNVDETTYFPSFVVRKNKIYYGRDYLEIRDKTIVINGKEYSPTGPDFVGFLEQVCQDVGCGRSKNSAIERALFPEAKAFGWLALGLAFAGGFIIGKWGKNIWNWFKRRRTARTSSDQRCTAGLLYRCGGSSIIRDEVADRRAEENYTCESGDLILESRNGSIVSIFNRRGERMLIPQSFHRRQFRTCEEAAREYNKIARHNQGRDVPDSFDRVSADNNELDSARQPAQNPNQKKETIFQKRMKRKFRLRGN